MKILHLFSNYKLTGPAEPAIRLASHLMQRGHEVIFAHSPVRHAGKGRIDDTAAALGITTTTEFKLPKHYKTLVMWRDLHRMARYFDQEEIDVVHANLVNDHVTAAWAVPRSKRRPKLVRTNHDAVPMTRDLRTTYVFPRRTDALIELSRPALEADVRRFRIPRGRVHLVDTAVELGRLDPARDLPNMRERWGLRGDEFVVGVAARIQRHRRFKTLLKAVAIARTQCPQLRLVIIGRGTHKEKVAVRPARKLGLSDITTFPGYLRGDEYVAGLLALDVNIFLKPGTDGSCRAAREAMAMGNPVIASKRGMLPELVTDGEDGLVVKDTPENLAGAILRLARDVDLRKRMGESARRAALKRFDPLRQAERIERIYRAILGRNASAK